MMGFAVSGTITIRGDIYIDDINNILSILSASTGLGYTSSFVGDLVRISLHTFDEDREFSHFVEMLEYCIERIKDNVRDIDIKVWDMGEPDKEIRKVIE